MLDVKSMLLGCAAYLRENPQEIWRAARKAAHLRFGVPLAALRWIAGQLEFEKGPKDVELVACPPGIRVTATFEEMGTSLRGSAVLRITEVDPSADHLRVVLRISQVTVDVLGDAATPLGALIRSGALDLNRVADLVAHLPTRPPILVEAVEDRLVLDFMRLPQIAREPRAKQLITMVARLLKVEEVVADDTHLDVALKPFPEGPGAIFR